MLRRVLISARKEPQRSSLVSHVQYSFAEKSVCPLVLLFAVDILIFVCFAAFWLECSATWRGRKEKFLLTFGVHILGAVM